MKIYRTEEEKREQVKKWYNKRKSDLDDIKRELGFRTTWSKPINTAGERKRQEQITKLWKLYGWFIDVENKDTRETVEDIIEEEEFEGDFIEDEELDEDIVNDIETFFGENNNNI